MPPTTRSTDVDLIRRIGMAAVGIRSLMPYHAERPSSGPDVTYSAFFSRGRKYVQTICVRRGGILTERETGVTDRRFRDAENAVGDLNRVMPRR